MAIKERKSPERDATREAGAPRERAHTGTAGATPSPEGAAEPRGMNVVPEPEQEEAPELLGERSDYPVPFAEDDDDEPRR